jgi:hypothetical protein
MRLKLTFLIACLAALQQGRTQDSILHRIILVGDAGVIDRQQKLVIGSAVEKVIPGKTTVIYLGDNVYYTGMSMNGGKEEEEGRTILQSQFQPMRARGAAVYFVPGNHDWDRSGKDGLEKIKRQWSYLDEQNDSLLKMVPANGCPDPYEINVSAGVTIIAYDSEWWLFPFDKRNAEADCDCKTKDDIIARFEQLLHKNRYKTILLASHHPFQSYGVHGGYFTLKDHIFPLTAANKNLYIPLPVVGSLYPLLRRTFTNPEDLPNPEYKEMVRRISGVFKGFPNVMYAAGHEHGLQFIKGRHTQIVSGSGSRESSVKKGKHSLYAEEKPGYVTVDVLPGKNMQLSYYSTADSIFDKSFNYLQPYTSVKYSEDSSRRAMDTDSMTVAVRPEYNQKSKLHRLLFGENFRKEWAAPTVLPVIKISEFRGGLTPTERGGGMQSKSLRLVDKHGKEWVIRSVEKSPDALIPEDLRETFARDVVDDATSAQHPYSALIVPPIADAVKVPHAKPIIGIIAPDKNLGIHEKVFANTVCLIEEREPFGESDNTIKMLKNLRKDNDNTVDGREFLRARMLDLLVGDWDRHEDQWRWINTSKKNKDKLYVSVPRDRDQVLHLTEGIFPTFASRPWVLPTLQGFGGKIKSVKYSLFKTRFLNDHPALQFSYDKWTDITKGFAAEVNDTVLEKSLLQLPASSYNIRHDKLYAELKERRDNLPKAMDKYYRFINRIVDIHTTDKNELVTITDANTNALRITIQKINKDGEIRDTLMDKVYDPSLTREIRIYIAKGDDSVVVNNSSSSIKLRIIGGSGEKQYNILDAKRKINVYEKKGSATFQGEVGQLRKHLSNDSLNTAYVPVNLYNVTQPLISIGFNLDDGFVFGLGVKHTHQGFRKLPYGSVQQLTAAHSFSTGAYRIRYKGEWLKVFRQADLILLAEARAPDNTQNFFGRGNETAFDKTGNWQRYYRTRFSFYQFNPALRWRGDKGSSISIGPSLNYYRYDSTENKSRFINNISQIGSYDSTTIDRNKLHAGLIVNYTNDKRNNSVFPASGSFVSIRMQGYGGLNKYSKNFVQVLPEVSIYRSLNARKTIILANRLGGGVTIGKTAFYQSLFTGGHENLLGYRQYRFAGQHSLYNNLELRIKLAKVASYILPGQLGLTGFFDIGRVWEKNDVSGKWHNGVGGGIYFAPAQIAVLQFVMGHSSEGWYPYFTMGFRF